MLGIYQLIFRCLRSVIFLTNPETRCSSGASKVSAVAGGTPNLVCSVVCQECLVYEQEQMKTRHNKVDHGIGRLLLYTGQRSLHSSNTLIR